MYSTIHKFTGKLKLISEAEVAYMACSTYIWATYELQFLSFVIKQSLLTL